MPIPFIAIKGLVGAGKKAVGKIIARRATTATAKKAVTTAKKAGATAKKAGTTATLSPNTANFVRTAILNIPNKITGGLKHGARKVATLKNKANLKKAGAFGAGGVVGAGVGHHLNQQRQKEEQRRQEERQVTSFQVQQQRKEEQGQRVEQRRQEQDEIRQDYRRQEGDAFVDTGQMFGDKSQIKTNWKRFFPPFIFSLLILLFLFVISERDRK